LGDSGWGAEEAKVEHVSRFVAWLRALGENVTVLEGGTSRCSPATVNRHLAALFSFYQACNGVALAQSLVAWRRVSRGGYRPFLHCGEVAMDDWLHRYAGQNRRKNTAATWVIADQDYRVAAHATVSMTAIDHSAESARLHKAAPDPVPALLVGRLAVDETFAGLGWTPRWCVTCSRPRLR